MATLEMSDSTGAHCQIEIDDASPVAQSKLQKLVAPVTAIVSDLGNSIDQAKFKSASLGGTFSAPAIDADDTWTVIIKPGANAALRIFQVSDGFLFGKDPYAPPIAIAKGEAWMSFEVDANLAVAPNRPVAIGTPSGFGVAVGVSTGCVFTTFSRFQPTAGALPIGKECLGATFSNFKILKSAQDVRNQKPGTVQACDISGSIKFTGSYSLPMSMNGLSLASVSTPSSLPFNYTVTLEPEFQLELQGSIAVGGAYSVRSYRVSETELQFGVYKKKQTELAVGFSAAAGLEAEKNGTTDLFTKFFKKVAPKVDPKQAGLSDADCGAMEKVLSASVDRSLSICLNVACSASFADEAAFVYRIDLTKNQDDTDAALNSAFKGDWTKLQQLSNATELRNVIGETKGRKHVAKVNLLGIYNYDSTADFIVSCTILHSPEDGTITVTDKQTASRIAVATTPYVAAPDRLQKVLNEACIATMTYTAAGAASKLTADIQVSQSLLIYNQKMDAKSVHKDLLTAVALRLVSQNDWQNLLPNNPNPLHVRIGGQALFAGDAALQLFFSDPAARTPRKVEDLKRLGRNVLASLLDPSNPIDVKRQQNLNDDDVWAQMDNNQWTPELQQLSYPDWYDITFWAEAIANVAPALSATLAAVDSVPPGQDPSKNADFMKKRANLAHAISAAVKDSHAAYEAGWPLAVLCALSDFKAKMSFQAAWDGQTHLDKQPAPAVAAVAGATPTQP